jgi:hypothetical protein
MEPGLWVFRHTRSGESLTFQEWRTWNLLLPPVGSYMGRTWMEQLLSSLGSRMATKGFLWPSPSPALWYLIEAPWSPSL